MPRYVQVTVEPRCSTCKLPEEKRQAVNEWLGRLGEEIDGEKVTWEFLLARLPFAVGKRLSLTALRRHRAEHLREVAGGEASDAHAGSDPAAPQLALDTEALLAKVDSLIESGEPSPTGILSLQLSAYLHDLRRRIAQNQRIEMSADQAARAAQALVKAERTGYENTLLHALSQSCSAQNAFGAPDDITGELEAENPINVEYEVVDDEGRERDGD